MHDVQPAFYHRKKEDRISEEDGFMTNNCLRLVFRQNDPWKGWGKLEVEIWEMQGIIITRSSEVFGDTVSKRVDCDYMHDTLSGKRGALS